MKLSSTIILAFFVFFLALGLAISLQGVLGINIGSALDMGGNKIINVGAPAALGDLATKGLLDSTFTTANFQARVTGSCPLGKVIRVINQDGTVICE